MELNGSTEVSTDNSQSNSASEPFVGRWQNLISTTNWEKGKIIVQWREALLESGAPATEYSDECWAQRVGGVTSPHVGRLRRVYERFGNEHETYPGLYWSHFLAGLDWDDAEMWLEGAMRSGWSVSAMREERWRANGAAEEQRPEKSEIVSADNDEDVVLPAQGSEPSQFTDGSSEIAPGPAPEDPDFGEEPISSTRDSLDSPTETSGEIVQPFAGLPELPEDLAEALESFKLSVLRHKSANWVDVSRDTVLQALDGLKALATTEA